MDEGWGMLQWGVDQYGSHTVGTGHLQSLISREEKLEKQATKSAMVTEGHAASDTRVVLGESYRLQTGVSMKNSGWETEQKNIMASKNTKAITKKGLGLH